MLEFPLFPEQASTYAARVDLLYFVLTGLSAFFTFGIVASILYLAVRYHHGSNADRSNAEATTHNTKLEVTWIVVLSVLGLGMFAWAATTYFHIRTPPREATLEIYGIGKQWMWKFQHPNGVREINHLHVPAGQPVRMILASQDVIHSFYVPAFRTKQDVIPGRYMSLWFEATRPGRYHLFCAEYCGTEHSYMRGTVYVMEPERYEAWLYAGDEEGDGGPADEDFDAVVRDLERLSETSPEGPFRRDGAAQDAPPVDLPLQPTALIEQGRVLFETLRCNTCHRTDTTALYPSRGPLLWDLYGRSIPLDNHRTIVADETYIRESILNPQARIVQGYPAVMPTYQGQLDEEELLALVVYLRYLGDNAAPPADTTQP